MRNRERGSAMLVTLIIITALFSGAAALASMQITSTRSSATFRNKVQSESCAEAGLALARSAVIANYAAWNAALQAGGQPTWLASLDRDLDGDHVADFVLSIKDNEDEGIAANDPDQDSDSAIYIVSTCTKFADTPTSLAELVRYSGGGSCYQSQFGGCGGNSNAN